MIPTLHRVIGRKSKKVHTASPAVCQGQHKASNNSCYHSDWLNKSWYIDKVEYYLAIKNAILELTCGEGNGTPHGRRSLVGCSPWCSEELDTTEQLHFHFSLSCIGERNGNPLQCSCLENPRDIEAWWAAVYVITQSRTQLKRLSSSSSRANMHKLQSNLWAKLGSLPGL